jgi:hypothetical protein
MGDRRSNGMEIGNVSCHASEKQKNTDKKTYEYGAEYGT